ncbi:MAG: flagellar export protein FliJ [Pseudomonadota bacterium]
MAKKFPLQSLLDLSQNRTDAAAKKLSSLKVRWQEAEDKLNQLEQYRAEYQERLRLALQRGIGAAEWRDFQAFLSKLELAIRQQAEESQRCKRAWENGQKDWLSESGKFKAFDTLAQRHHEVESKREAQIEQREHDDLVTRSHGKPREES